MMNADNFREAATADSFKEVNVTSTDDAEDMRDAQAFQCFGNLLAYFDFFLRIHLKVPSVHARLFSVSEHSCSIDNASTDRACPHR
ncbi:hypothetical protein CF161_15692 [Pseudomonas sp. CF161]|nr:hypothetical protein CF161_15692 [Pseudomonas sp. CF161]